jgi:hypothetical protein
VNNLGIKTLAILILLFGSVSIELHTLGSSSTVIGLISITCGAVMIVIIGD